MSARLNFFYGITYTRDGVTREYGSMTQPVAEVSLDGDFADEQEFSIAAATTVTVYTYSAGKPDFALMVLEGDGPLDVELKLDSPTSTTDKTALGTYINYVGWEMDAHAPLVISSDQGRVQLSATARSSANIASATEGAVYEVKVRNNGTVTRALTVRMFN